MKAALRKDAEQLVSALYRRLLRREADPSVFKHYVAGKFKAVRAINMFVPPGHFYSPIVDPAVAERHLARLEATEAPDALSGIAIDKELMVEVWQSLLPFVASAPFPEQKTTTFRYAFENPAYSWGDGSVLHAMLRLHRPKRVVEVGSGWSSACTLDTVEKYLDGDCELTFVEPFPQLLLDLSGDAKGKLHILDRPIQEVPLEMFDNLEAGDFLFIDSTHILSTGSDVCFELFQVLPRLRPGVFVHFHDMFWPFEYPRIWAVDENRSWNELYAMRAFLTNNNAWRIYFFNDYFAKCSRPAVQSTYPRVLRNPGGALWLQRN